MGALFQLRVSAQAPGLSPAQVDSLLQAATRQDTSTIPVLYDTGRQLNRQNRPAEGLRCLLRAREMAEQSRQMVWQLRLATVLCQADLPNGKNHLLRAQSVWEHPEAVRERDLGDWLNFILKTGLFIGSAEGFRLMLILENRALQQHFSPAALQDLYQVRSNVYFQIGDYDNAIRYARQSEGAAVQTGQWSKIETARLWEANIQTAFKHDEAVDTLLPLILRDTGQVTGQEKADIITETAIILLHNKRAEAALQLIRQYPQIPTGPGRQRLLGQALLELRQFEKAEACLLQYYRDSGQSAQLTYTGSESLGKLYYQWEHYREACRYLGPYARYRQAVGANFVTGDELDYLKMLADASSHLGDFRSAATYLEQLSDFKDSIALRNDQNRIARMQIGQLETAQREQIGKMAEQNRQQALRTNTAGGVALLFILLAGLTLFQYRRLRLAKRQNDSLLLNILPQSIVERMRQGEQPIADYMSEVSVMFVDIVDFTGISTRIPPAELVQLLNTVFARLDVLCAQYQLEKIKTIGDCYMAAAGVPLPQARHLEQTLDMALDILRNVDGMEVNGLSIRLKIGIDSGPAMAGVIGKKKFIFDLWGDTVNMASRMESNGIAGTVQVTERVYCQLVGQYPFERRGDVQIKGKGQMCTYLLR